MRLGLLAAALILLLTSPALAQSCPRGDSRWTDGEYDAWRAICAGQTLDVTPPYGRMEPPLPGQPVAPNVLSAAFVRTILTVEPYASAVPTVHIVGAIVTGVLDLRGLAIRPDVLFYDSHFLDGVVLDEMNGAGTWAFVHCYLPKPLHARGTRIAGGFSLAEGFAAEGVDLSGLAVQGDAVLRYLETRSLVANGLKTGAQLDLVQITVGNGEFALAGARVGSDAVIAPSGAVRGVDLAGATIGGRLTLGPMTWAAPARLNLAAARLAALTALSPLPAETGMPYRELAAALTAGGDTRVAAMVLRRGLERERVEGPLPQRLWLTVRKWTTGYGTEPGGYRQAAGLLALALAAAAGVAWAFWRRRA